MTANVRIVTDVHEDVLKVPNAALRFRPPQNDKEKSERKAGGNGSGNSAGGRPHGGRGAPGSARVYQLQAGKLVPLPVQLGASDGLMTEVTAPSLSEGSEVVIGTLEQADSKRRSPSMGGGPRMF
jgi:HlyD family secretion protein